MDWIRNNKSIVALGVAILVVIIIIIIGYTTEHFGDVFYLDQISMKNSDPMSFKYRGRERDVLGESPRDYYLMNRIYANNRAAPQYFDDSAFANQTAYLDMPGRPHEYRHDIA